MYLPYVHDLLHVIHFFFVCLIALLQGALPNLPEMVSDEEAQRTARKSALIVARMKDGSFRYFRRLSQACLINTYLPVILRQLAELKFWLTWTMLGLPTQARTCSPAASPTSTLFRCETVLAG